MRIPLLLATLGFAACEPMESRGNPFTPAPRAVPPSAPAPTEFDFPADPPLIITSEQMAQGDSTTSLAAAAGVDADALEPAGAPPAAPGAPSAPALTAAPPTGFGWPVRLLSTIPQAQPPRAILGLPSGEERVVSPGSILAEQGLVVMMVTADRVQLARIEAAGDHARIDTFELSSQYPTP